MADAIDPALYAKIFEINKPCWQTVSDSLKKLNLPSDAKILDLGAGPAEPTATILAATPTYKITCTDSQEAMIEKGKMRCTKKLGEEVTAEVNFVVALAEDLSAYADDTFDAVIGRYLLMFVDCPKCLAEVKRVLKPSGYALFTIWLQMPFFYMNQAIVNDMWSDFRVKQTADESASGGSAALGVPPKIVVQPMSLSSTQYNTKGDVGVMSREAGFKSAFGITDMAYDWHMNLDLDGLVGVSRILTNGVMPKMAEQLGMEVEALHLEHAARLKKEISEKHADWDRGSEWVWGRGEARLYTLQK